MFVDFITGSHDAFVIEDTDNLLKARTSGNDEMHRFLAIADGVARSQGRKIIFTTNLPNVTDIDEALVRPGRCYAVKNLRSLEPAEALTLARRMCAEDEERFGRAQAALEAIGGRTRFGRAGVSRHRLRPGMIRAGAGRGRRIRLLPDPLPGTSLFRSCRDRGWWRSSPRSACGAARA